MVKNIYKYIKASKRLTLLVLALLLLAPSLFVFVPKSSAATLNITMVRLNRLAISTATGGTICAEPGSTSSTVGKVLLTFPAGFTVGASWTTDTANTTGWPTGGTAWPSIQATGTGSGQVATFTSGNLTSTSTLYCFNWTNTSALTNPSSSAQDLVNVATQTSGSVAIDSNNATVDIINANCGSGSTPCDQIAVTASVNQSFTFSLSSNSVTFGALSTSTPTASSAINATVSTNAKTGWQIWAADPAAGGQTGLYSTSAAHEIAYTPGAGSAASALSNGTEGYNVGTGNLAGTTCSGTPTYGNFASGGTNYKGSGLDNTLRSMVAVAASGGSASANACSIPVTVNASISNTTPAALDYAGTITVVGAGLF